MPSIERMRRSTSRRHRSNMCAGWRGTEGGIRRRNLCPALESGAMQRTPLRGMVTGDRMMAMGHIFADIELSNPSRPELHGVAVKALADAGALMLCIPEHVALQLEVARES